MKIQFFLIAAVLGLFLISSCNNGVSVDQVLQDETARKQLFGKVVSDHEMLTEMMNTMMSNEHAQMMMKGNEGMKNMMMEGADMMGMMKGKPEMMHKMMSSMMKDKDMMTHMMKMMKDQGMMSEECMQSCMEMMGNMDMGDMDMGEMGDKKEMGDGHDHQH